MTSYDFAISGQHYLFDVQSFAHTILPSTSWPSPRRSWPCRQATPS